MKITIHEVTLTVSFNSDESMQAAEMAAMLVRECECAAHRVNTYFQPVEPVKAIHDAAEVASKEVGDDPF